MNETEPIDFCVALSGPNVGVLYKLFWVTLSRHCNLSATTFHIINKDVPSSVMDVVVGLMQGYTTKVYKLPRVVDASLDFNGYDVDYTCDFMMRSCGICNWACISHFDMWFKKDWLTFARQRIADDVAVIGNHCPIMLVNRAAYKYTTVKFSCAEGMDTGKMLQREMVDLGWRVESYPELNKESDTLAAQEWFHHIGGGGWHYNEPEVSVKFKFAIEKMEELGI